MNRPLRAVLRGAPAAALLAVLVLLGACSGAALKGKPTASYASVPDTELYRRIAALPHVTKVGIDFQDTFENGRSYRGVVTTDGLENPYLTLDKTIAILRQGQPDAAISLNVDFPGPDGRTLTAFSTRFVPLSSTDLAQRYGPQPGDGTPPASRPVPTPSNWTPPGP